MEAYWYQSCTFQTLHLGKKLAGISCFLARRECAFKSTIQFPYTLIVGLPAISCNTNALLKSFLKTTDFISLFKAPFHVMEYEANA